MICPDKKSRRALHSHEKRCGRVSRSTYLSLFSRKNTTEGYTRHLESLGDVCIELIPLTAGTRLVNLETLLPIMDGHIVTITTNDPINAPLPHRDLLMLQCFFIRVLRMAGRADEDMLETFDSDDELTTSSAGSIEQQTAHELIQSPPYHNGTADLKKASLALSPGLGTNIATPLEQSLQKKRWRLSRENNLLISVLILLYLWSSRKNSDGGLSRINLSSCHVCEAFSHILTAKMARTGQPSYFPKEGLTDKSQRLE